MLIKNTDEEISRRCEQMWLADSVLMVSISRFQNPYGKSQGWNPKPILRKKHEVGRLPARQWSRQREGRRG